MIRSRIFETKFRFENGDDNWRAHLEVSCVQNSMTYVYSNILIRYC